jgi:hypothetical protein
MSGAKLLPHRSALSFGIARRHRWRDWLGRRAGESTEDVEVERLRPQVWLAWQKSVASARSPTVIENAGFTDGFERRAAGARRPDPTFRNFGAGAAKFEPERTRPAREIESRFCRIFLDGGAALLSEREVLQ